MNLCHLKIANLEFKIILYLPACSKQRKIKIFPFRTNSQSGQNRKKSEVRNIYSKKILNISVKKNISECRLIFSNYKISKPRKIFESRDLSARQLLISFFFKLKGHSSSNIRPVNNLLEQTRLQIKVLKNSPENGRPGLKMESRTENGRG